MGRDGRRWDAVYSRARVRARRGSSGTGSAPARGLARERRIVAASGGSRPANAAAAVGLEGLAELARCVWTDEELQGFRLDSINRAQIAAKRAELGLSDAPRAAPTAEDHPPTAIGVTGAMRAASSERSIPYKSRQPHSAAH